MHSGLPIRVNWTSFARCYGWDATSENRLKIGIVQGGGSIFTKFSPIRRHPPPITFAQIVRPMNASQHCRWQFSHKKINFVADFLQVKCDFTWKTGSLHFWAPKGLWATYDDRLRLTGKRIEDFLLLRIELFSLGVTAEAVRANNGSIGYFAPEGAGWSKILSRNYQPFLSEN